jgi:predicted dehydrogenase
MTRAIVQRPGREKIPVSHAKVALVEVGHWHASMYAAALRALGVPVAAVCDRDRERARAVAAETGATAFGSVDELLAGADVDFVFAFGRHLDMPGIAEKLLARRIPFAIEKPAGLCAADVARTRRLAESAGVFVAVPLVFRVSPLLAEIARAEGTLPARFGHLAFRSMHGGPQRYLASGNAWLLDLAQSGGGCTINLSVHFVDLFFALTGEPVATVYARLSHRTHRLAVEDHSLLVLTGRDGAVCEIETSYTFPPDARAKREFYLSVASERIYAHRAEGGLWMARRDGAGVRLVPVELDNDALYPLFVERTLADVRAGRPPVAGLAELEAVMRVVDAAYRSHRTGQVVTLDA